MGDEPRIVAIVGPTASGKTELALRLAERWGGEIVCVDSMQVYRGLDIGTAKPTREEQTRIPHHGLDLAEPTELFNANRFCEALAPVVERLIREGKPIWLCGGTGLYFRSLLEGLDPAPSCDPALRRSFQDRLEHDGPEVLHYELQQIDPKRAAALHPHDAKRVIRALEIAVLSGNPPSQLMAGGNRNWGKHTHYIGLDPGQELLRQRIEMRLRRMVRDGLLAEMAWLLELGWERVTTARQAVGYKEFLPFFHCQQGLGECMITAIRRTARLATRQRSWFQRQVQVSWYQDGQQDFGKIEGIVSKFLAAPSLSMSTGAQ